MCTGAVSNIFLDWLFIFPLQMGVIGAAVASGLGQIFSLLVLLSHFTRKHGNLRIRHFTIQPALIRKICKRGAPEAVTQLKDTKEINDYFRVGMAVNLVLSVLVSAGLIIFDESVIRIFNQDQELVSAASKALPVFGLSFIPMAFNLVYTSLLYSTKRTMQSDIIAICRGIIVKAIAVFSIPVIWGSGMIWIAPLVAETITLVIAVVLTQKTKVVY